jgi:hypothetical protein
MQSFLIGGAGLASEALLLFRAVKGKTLGKFPLFWSYIVCVLAVDVARDVTYYAHPASYRTLYWVTQFLTLLVGYGILLEIVQKSLAHYAGAERVARVLVLGVFVVVFSYVMFKSGTEPHWSPGATYVELERDLRAVQALVFIVILGVIYHYGITIGRNLKAICLGYGLYIGVSVLMLALRSYAPELIDTVGRTLLIYSSLVSLAIWIFGLWAYYPEPAPQPTQFEADYDALALKTKGAPSWVRSYLERTARS